ncbi:hypothetical protein NMY22_g15454 [Coprinellus aureogranulatus]|nr:hypothetical protein NMY22_g15454 [Coprinellus aureogranulatus]
MENENFGPYDQSSLQIQESTLHSGVYGYSQAPPAIAAGAPPPHASQWLEHGGYTGSSTSSFSLYSDIEQWDGAFGEFSLDMFEHYLKNV